MVKPPPDAPAVHPGSVNQLTVPVELESAVKDCPPTPAFTGLPKASWNWTVMTPAAPAHAPVPIASVMPAVEPVTVLPKVSCTVTCTAGEMAAPAVVLVGCTVKASFEAAAGVMLNPAEVAPVSGADAAVRV